ncbi:hypothetical protein GCK32_012629 [Trichostrongylus colubriformis]|uniref:Uncharacterized protein n=1 Tax=Trichostrongylus colubriformis TaxID=6319 RepID=A0AAN8FJB0_TRICO
MLFYVLIAFIALNVFTQEGVMAQRCEDRMLNNICADIYGKYCDDRDGLEHSVLKCAFLRYLLPVNSRSALYGYGELQVLCEYIYILP